MFTGIVEGVGVIQSIDARHLVVQPPAAFADGLALGESIAIDGCCLTVVSFDDGILFDVSEETLSRTTFGLKRAGDRVNLERAMRLSDRLGGHIVQGHVDGLAKLTAIETHPGSRVYTFEIERENDRYLIDKGSVTLDGVSLTVVEPVDGEFNVWLIPHTLAVTTLGDRQVGDRLNVEFDVLAKHLEKLIAVTAR